MFLDQEVTFSDAQALTLAALEPSTNILDLGAPGKTAYNSVQLKRRMSYGEVPLLIQVVEAFTGAMTSVQVAIQESIDEAFTVPVTLLAIDVAKTELVEGFIFPIDDLPRNIRKRYIRLAYTMNGTATAGKLTSGIVGAVDGAYRG